MNTAGQPLTIGDLGTILPMHEIHHGLWQGSHPNEDGDYDGFDMVASCEMYPRRRPLKNFTGMFIHLPFPDSDNPEDVPWGSIESAAEAVAHAVSTDHRVLVHCTAGLNRSSLLVHQALRGLGWSARDAVDLIRRQRSHWCLCNKTFEAMCLDH